LRAQKKEFTVPFKGRYLSSKFCLICGTSSLCLTPRHLSFHSERRIPFGAECPARPCPLGTRGLAPPCLVGTVFSFALFSSRLFLFDPCISESTACNRPCARAVSLRIQILLSDELRKNRGHLSREVVFVVGWMRPCPRCPRPSPWNL
jgi:hypothetical protein